MSRPHSQEQDELSAHLRSVLAGDHPLNSGRLQTAVDRLAEAALRCADGAAPAAHADNASEEQRDDPHKD